MPALKTTVKNQDDPEGGPYAVIAHTGVAGQFWGERIDRRKVVLEEYSVKGTLLYREVRSNNG